MAIDPSIPAKVADIDYNSLLEMQQKRIAIQKAQADKSVGEATQQSTDPDTGEIDYKKRAGIIAKNPLAARSAAEAAVQGQAQQVSQLQQHTDMLQRHAGIAGGWALNDAPPEKAVSDIDDEVKNGFLDPKAAIKAKAQIYGAAASDDPKALHNAYVSMFSQIKDNQAAAKQQLLETQNVQGQGGVGVQREDINPQSRTFGKKSFQAQVPAEGLVDITDPETGQTKKVLSSELRKQASGGGVATGTTRSTEQQIKDAADDWSDVKKQLPEYQKVHSDNQNIISLVKQGGTTGAAQGQRALADSIGALIPGFNEAQDLKTKNDLMQKFMAQANLTGGTDAGKALLSAANPHASMSGDAIIEAARYVDAAKKVQSQEKAEILGQHTGSHKEYNDKLVKYNAAMNPSVMMYVDMPQEEKASWLAKQPKETQRDIKDRLKKLDALTGGK